MYGYVTIEIDNRIYLPSSTYSWKKMFSSLRENEYTTSKMKFHVGKIVLSKSIDLKEFIFFVMGKLIFHKWEMPSYDEDFLHRNH